MQLSSTQIHRKGNFFVKFYLNPKEVYTRAARDKFHVCCTVSSCGVEFVLFTEWKSSKVWPKACNQPITVHYSTKLTARDQPECTIRWVVAFIHAITIYYYVKRLWPQSMVSITVPVLHQNHFSVRKIYKNKWKILLFQVNHFPPIGHYCTQRGWKRNVCALPRTEMHFCKSWFAPSKLYLFS